MTAGRVGGESASTYNRGARACQSFSI